MQIFTNTIIAVGIKNDVNADFFEALENLEISAERFTIAAEGDENHSRSEVRVWPDGDTATVAAMLKEHGYITQDEANELAEMGSVVDWIEIYEHAKDKDCE